jgi:predicted  nucleic acid-binding Zn-ribbon protein
MPFLSLFGKYWKYLLVAALVAGAFLYINGLKSTIADQEKQIDALTLENQIVKDNNAKLEGAITASNEAIGKLSTGAADTKKQFDNLNTTVKNQTAGLELRLRGILAEKKPQTCEDTIQYLLRAVEEYSK